MTHLRHLAALGLAVLLASPAWSFTAEEQRVERERIRTERAQVDATFDERERECRTRFVVSSCVEEAQRERRRALQKLREQQGVLDELERKQRAATRMDEIRAKLAEEDRPKRQPPSREPPKPRALPDPIELAPPTGTVAPKPSTPAEAAKKRADYERRQEEARQHRLDVERRNAERKASGKAPARPLPVPAAASGP